MRINEIFESISGEAGFFPQGSWCTFIRLQGCNLRCRWCDTLKAQDPEKGKEYTIEKLVNIVKALGNSRVLITGGEPLCQLTDLRALVERLVKLLDCSIQIETNGSFPIPIIPYGNTDWVVDYKLPSSGYAVGEVHDAFQYTLLDRDIAIIKFVLAPTESDIKAMLDEMINIGPYYNRPFLISPLGANGDVIPKVAKRISDEAGREMLDRAVFSLQIHRLIGMA